MEDWGEWRNARAIAPGSFARDWPEVWRLKRRTVQFGACPKDRQISDYNHKTVTSVHFTGRFAEHTTPPGHPERPERAEILAEVAAAAEGRGIKVHMPQPPAVTDLRRVHDAGYLSQLSGLAGRAAMLDEDTFTSPESIEVARLAAGAAIEAARGAVAANAPAIALVRPPGHHADAQSGDGLLPL